MGSLVGVACLQCLLLLHLTVPCVRDRRMPEVLAVARRSINGKAPNITMAIKGTHTGAAAADSEFLVAQASGPVILKHRV